MMNRKENFLRAVTRDNPGWVPYTWEGSWYIAAPSFTERPDHAALDSWGCRWDYHPVSGTYPSHAARFSDVSDIIHFAPPDPWKPGLLDRAKREIDQLADDTFILCSNHIGLHERSSIMLGMESYFICLIENPELIQRLFDTIAEFKYEFTRRMLKELEIDGIWFGDDWGSQQGMLFSPELWRAMIKPHMKRLYDLVHLHEKLVFQHSCGKIEEIIPDLVEIGTDVWNPCQPCNDLEMLKSTFGEKLCFMGGVDASILDSQDPQLIDDEVKQKIQLLGTNGGYILEPSHHLSFSRQSIKSFISSARRHGIYR